MNIVADFSASLTFDQELQTLQQHADNLQKELVNVLEQVGLKRQQVARALKALVEAKQSVKEAMKLACEVTENARIPLQREILELLEIPIALPPEVETKEPQPTTTPTDTEVEAETPVISQAPEVPVTAFLDHKDSETEELNDFDFLLSEPQTIVVRKIDSKIDIRKGIMGPILISEDYLFISRYEQHLHDKLDHTVGGYDTLLEEIGTDERPKWQLLISHLTAEQAQIMDLTEKEKELIAYQKNVESQKERTLALAESIGIDTTSQLVELSNRMTYVSADPDSGALEHCYIGGSNEAGLIAWGKWLTLSPDIASQFEVQPSTRTMKFKFELKLWGMSLTKLKVLCAEGMLTQPPRAKTAASKALGSKLLAAK